MFADLFIFSAGLTDEVAAVVNVDAECRCSICSNAW